MNENQPMEETNEVDESFIRNIDTQLGQKENWLNRNSPAIQAIALVVSIIVTTLLTIFAYKSWDEVRSQRELSRRQYILSNAPSVRAFIDSKIRYENDIPIFKMRLHNFGGSIKDINVRGLAFGLESKNTTSTAKLIISITTADSILRRNEWIDYEIWSDKPETLKLLKSSLSGESGYLIVYAEAEFTVPAELTLDGQEKREMVKDFAYWNQALKRLGNVNTKDQKTIQDLVENLKIK